MENEISPGVKVQVRVRDDAPTNQTPAPQALPLLGEVARSAEGVSRVEKLPVWKRQNAL